jgi:hypothetical protein
MTVATVPVPRATAAPGSRAIGLTAVVLSAATIALIALAAPWQVRFPVLAIAVIFGPGIPLLRLNSHFSAFECLVYGIGLSVALQMLVGLSLVLAHTWVPTAAVIGLLAISALAGVKLIWDTRGSS